MQKVKRVELQRAIEKVFAAAYRNEKKAIVIANGKIVGSADTLVVFSDLVPEIEAVVKADDFLTLIKSLDSKYLKLSSNKTFLNIRASGVNAKLRQISPLNDFSQEISFADKIDNERWISLPKNFNEGLKLCLFSASTDKSQTLINGVLCRGKKIISTDDMRVGQYNLKKKLKEDFFLPLDNASLINKLSGGRLVSYQSDQKWVYLLDDTETVYCSAKAEISENFPTDEVFNVDGEEYIFPKKIGDMLDLSLIFANGELEFEKEIKVVFDGKKVFCLGENDTGSIRASAKLNKKAKKTTISINPIFLKEILQTVKVTTATIGEELVLFETEGFRHVIAQWANVQEEENEEENEEEEE